MPHFNPKGRLFFKMAFILNLSLISACATETGAIRLDNFVDLQLTPDHFSICHGYGCQYQTQTQLSDSEWKRVIAPLLTPADTAAQERERIAQAIAKMETHVGEATGTQFDKAGAGFIIDNPGQMDCIDEAINSSLYLHFFQNEGLLHWHRVSTPTRRGYLIDTRWPHNSAVIEEKATGERYVVDSWFYANGQPPVIVPVKLWLTGWKPPKQVEASPVN